MTPGRIDPQQQFIALAGLRGLAALVVLQRHGATFLGGAPLSGGYLAVDFFFLLSGWVLAHAYDHRLDTSMSPLSFMRARLIRLYPVYLLGLFLTFTGSVAQRQYPVGGLLTALIFLPNFWSIHLDWLLFAAWSLTAELIANLVFAMFHRFLTARVLATVCAISLLMLVSCAWIYGSLDIGHFLTTWPGLFTRVFFSFPLGILLYRKRATLSAWAPAWATWPSLVLLAGCLAIPARPDFQAVRDLLVVAILLPAVLLFASRARPTPLTAAAAAALGDLSYPLYLLHVFIFSATNAALLLLFDTELGSAPLTFAIPLVVGIMGASWLVDRYFDRPVRRYLSAVRTPAAREPSATLAPP